MGTVNEHWKDGVGVEKQRWNSLRLRGLRQRWIFNSIVPILAMLVLIVALFSAGVSN